MAKQLLALGMLVLVGAACSKGPDLDEVPIGSEVQLTRQDGGVVEGTLAARDADKVAVDVGRVTRNVSRQDVAHVGVVGDDGKEPELPAIARFREYRVPGETRISVRLGEAVGSATSKAGDIVSATLADPVTIDGVQVLPAGSPVHAEVAAAEPSGKVKGRARLALSFDRITANGENYPIDAGYSMVAEATKARDAKTIGIPAAGGAVLGAVLGGKKGAAIGAGIGGGAGTAVVLTTAGKEVGLGSGAEVRVTIGTTLDVKVPLTPNSDKSES
jgi:hypothetical protein